MFLFTFFLMKLKLKFTDMLNHSFQPNCFLHWRFRDRMLEVLINAGQGVKEGEEVLYDICISFMYAISINNR
jgi:SET domain